MGKLQKLKHIWGIVVKNWKTRFRLVFSNEETLEQRLVVQHITIQKAAVVIIIAAFVVIVLTTLLIAFTPLRVYIPGYTSQKDYKQYKLAAAKIDSLEKAIEYNQQFMDNYIAMANGRVPTANEMDSNAAATPQVHAKKRDSLRTRQSHKILEEAEMILGRVQKNNTANTPGIDQAKISNLSIYPPASGAVCRLFSPDENHYGIDIRGSQNSTVCCVADGVVIFAGYNANDGHFIVVQHPGNLTSIYKRNSRVLKRIGDRVSAGSPIALMGNTGATGSKTVHLHFELWYNGFPINPLDYLVIQ